MDNFFHDINKRLNDIGSRQDLAESEKWIQKAINPAHKGNLHRALHVPADKKIPAGKLEKATHSSNPKIKKQAVLAKTLRGLKESDPTDMNEADMDESALQAYLGKKKYGPEGMKALQKAGREHAGKSKMDQIRNRYDKMDEADMVGLEEEDMEEGNEFSGARQAAIKAGKSSFSVDGKTYRVTGDTSDEEKMSEGYFKNLDIERQERAAKARHKGGLNQVPGMQNLKPGTREHPLKNVAKGVKAFVQGKLEPMDEAKAKAKPDYIDLDHDGDKKETMKKAAADKKRSTGTAFDPDTRKHMKTDQEGTGKFDKKKISTGTVYTRRHSEDDDEEVKSDQPKRKGRPKGPAKGPERVTAKSYKYKQGRPVKEMEIPIINRGEYDQEGDEVKGDMHTVIRHAQELERHLRDSENLPTWIIEKVGQIKGMMTSISDYMLSQHERNAEHETGTEGIRIAEKITKNTPTGEVIHDFVHSKNPKFAGKSKKERINQALGASYAMKKGKMEEESTDTRDQHAEHAGRKVTKDIEYDEKKKDGIHGKKRGGEDAKAERAGRKVAKDIEYDEKHKKVKETTAGSVATATNSAPKAKGMTFGKGIYEDSIAESFDKKLSSVLNEGINVSLNMNAEGQKSINVSADGADAEKLAEILKLAGMGAPAGACDSCGQSPCGCHEQVSENQPDWPTDTVTTDADDPHLRRFSGGLNGAKSTGQTTIPVIAGQRGRMSTMEETVALERSLFDLYKNYRAQ
jgi:hypothetical protein